MFVFRRLAAMARQAHVHALQPVPYFPIARPLPDWSLRPARQEGNLDVSHAPMFYVPGVLKSLDGFWLYRAVRDSLSRLHNTNGLDVIDAHFGYPEGVGALMAARRLGIPATVTLRGFEAEYLQKPLISSQIRNVLSNADGLICVSHFLKDLALQHGADPDKVCVIHNAIDRKTFFPSDKSDARQQLGLPDTAKIIVSVGHLVLRKRHHVLIEAFAELIKAHPDAMLLIVGGDSFGSVYPDRLVRLVAKLGLEKSVRFPGNVSANEVAQYYHAADMFVLGTQREGCCNAVLESLACGIPVITTPVGDNEFFVKNGLNGYIVPVDDVPATSRAILEAVRRDDWNKSEISGNLRVGDWDSVAKDVLTFMSESVCKS